MHTVYYRNTIVLIKMYLLNVHLHINYLYMIGKMFMSRFVEEHITCSFWILFLSK